VACCSAEALAASLRLTGRPVSDEDVLALYWHTARDEDAGASILATLEAAGEFGLAGVRPVSFGPVSVPSLDVPEQGEPLLRGSFHLGCPEGIRDEGDLHLGPVHAASVILGLELPAPHAVLDTGAEWISWGEPWPAWAFPDAVVSEAWSVTWEAP
jgi:hypothetical protein